MLTGIVMQTGMCQTKESQSRHKKRPAWATYEAGLSYGSSRLGLHGFIAAKIPMRNPKTGFGFFAGFDAYEYMGRNEQKRTSPLCLSPIIVQRILLRSGAYLEKFSSRLWNGDTGEY